MLTAKQLIEELQKVPEDAIVFFVDRRYVKGTSAFRQFYRDQLNPVENVVVQQTDYGAFDREIKATRIVLT